MVMTGQPEVNLESTWSFGDDDEALSSLRHQHPRHHLRPPTCHGWLLKRTWHGTRAVAVSDQ